MPHRACCPPGHAVTATSALHGSNFLPCVPLRTSDCYRQRWHVTYSMETAASTAAVPAQPAGEESCLRGSGRTASLAAHRDYAVGEEVFDSYSPW